MPDDDELRPITSDNLPTPQRGGASRHSPFPEKLGLAYAEVYARGCPEMPCSIFDFIPACVSGLLFCAASTGIIMLNKWIIASMGFRLPMTLSFLGMAFSFVASLALVKLTDWVPRNVDITPAFALRRALPTEGELLALRAQQDEQRASVERVWPEPWKGSYSPPNEENAEPAPAPYPLAEAFVETADRAPADPPDVAYPTEAAEAAARRAEAVAAKISVAAADANADARADAEAEKEGVAEGRASPPIHASASALQSAAASESTQLAKRVKALQGDLAAAAAVLPEARLVAPRRVPPGGEGGVPAVEREPPAPVPARDDGRAGARVGLFAQ